MITQVNTNTRSFIWRTKRGRVTNVLGYPDGQEVTSETELFGRTKTLGRTSRNRQADGDIDVNDRLFYISGNVAIQNQDEMIYENTVYTVREVTYREHGDFTSVLAKSREKGLD